MGEGPERSAVGLPMEVQGGDRLMEAEARKTWAKTERIPPLGGGSHCGRTLGQRRASHGPTIVAREAKTVREKKA